MQFETLQHQSWQDVKLLNTLTATRRMNHFKIVNLAIYGTVFILLYFGVEADCSSSCSPPGLPGRDGVAGQPGRDGRDGVPGPAGSPGGQLHGYLHDKCDTPTITTEMLHVQTCFYKTIERKNHFRCTLRRTEDKWNNRYCATVLQVCKIIKRFYKD